MLPSSYLPTCPEEFIGPARHCAEFLRAHYVPALQTSREPWQVIFTGPPGTGKSALAGLLARELGGNQWNTTKLNGRQVKTDEVEDICRAFHFKDLFGAYRFLLVEELDKIPPDARSRLLTAVDDMPPGWIFAGTTNLPKKDFVKLHEATASRYEFMEIAAPSTEEVLAFLAQHWPQVPAAERRMVAVFWNGNVRGTLRELNAHFLAATGAVLTSTPNLTPRYA